MEVPGAEITRTPAWAAIATVSSREPPSTRTASKSASWATRLDNAVRRWVAAFSAGMTTAMSGGFAGIGPWYGGDAPSDAGVSARRARATEHLTFEQQGAHVASEHDIEFRDG